jgi:hypothetical protein
MIQTRISQKRIYHPLNTTNSHPSNKKTKKERYIILAADLFQNNAILYHPNTILIFSLRG